MTKQINLDEFCRYLNDQVGMPYVWGGQHLMLTPDNYVAVITRRETDEKHRKQAIAYCKKLFNKGATVLFAYDCSGLGMYWLQNVTHTYDNDMNANIMMRTCQIVSEPKRGYWVFKTDKSGRATHVGYMISSTELIEAKGRAYGVVVTKYKKSAWNRIGKPECVDFNEPVPGPDTYVFTRNLKYGCIGEDVIELKKLLIEHGFGNGISVDKASSKCFGSKTKKCVKEYQKSARLTVDGIAGHDTILSLGGVWLGE